MVLPRNAFRVDLADTYHEEIPTHGQADPGKERECKPFYIYLLLGSYLDIKINASKKSSWHRRP